MIVVEATDNCDPNPTTLVLTNDEPDTDPRNGACDALSVEGQATDQNSNVGTGCGGGPCPVSISVNPNDCDSAFTSAPITW